MDQPIKNYETLSAGRGKKSLFISPNKYVSVWVRLHNTYLIRINRVGKNLGHPLIQKILGHFITSDVAQTCMEF